MGSIDGYVFTTQCHKVMGGLLIDLTSVAVALLLRYTLSYKTNSIKIQQFLRYFTKYKEY